MQAMDNSNCSEKESINDINLSSSQTTVLVILYSILAVCILFENATIFIAYKSSYEVRQLPFNLLTVNLAIADFCIGLFNIPYHILTVLLPGIENVLALAIPVLYVGYVLTMTSVFTVVVMCLDRLYLITNPINYKSRRTNSGNIKIIVATWVFSLIYCSLILVVRGLLRRNNASCESNIPYLIFMLGMNIFIPFLCLAGLNCIILFKLQLHFAKMRRMLKRRSIQMNVGTTGTLPHNQRGVNVRKFLDHLYTTRGTRGEEPVQRTGLPLPPTPAEGDKSPPPLPKGIPDDDSIYFNDTKLASVSEEVSQVGESSHDQLSRRKLPTKSSNAWKAAINIIIFVIIYLSCWIPTHAYFFFKAINDFPLYNSMDLLQHLLYMTLYLNSAVNPILYAFMGKRFLTAICTMFTRTQRER
ncbi:putative histamine H4 receptor isoform 1 [Apostichopus japonicus]|uniref:Putative histamine H4 receptor isoform 1 n=1 Tax=Stichopus japonicus TaxID=307972 RepID=A0A2G8KHM7_STIJA|nr:putative histamine H4 receptor isoform 1 [Apostichopus japonicus]